MIFPVSLASFRRVSLVSDVPTRQMGLLQLPASQAVAWGAVWGPASGQIRSDTRSLGFECLCFTAFWLDTTYEKTILALVAAET